MSLRRVQHGITASQYTVLGSGKEPQKVRDHIKDYMGEKGLSSGDFRVLLESSPPWLRIILSELKRQQQRLDASDSENEADPDSDTSASEEDEDSVQFLCPDGYEYKGVWRKFMRGIASRAPACCLVNPIGAAEIDRQKLTGEQEHRFFSDLIAVLGEGSTAEPGPSSISKEILLELLEVRLPVFYMVLQDVFEQRRTETIEIPTFLRGYVERLGVIDKHYRSIVREHGASARVNADVTNNDNVGEGDTVEFPRLRESAILPPQTPVTLQEDFERGAVFRSELRYQRLGLPLFPIDSKNARARQKRAEKSCNKETKKANNLTSGIFSFSCPHRSVNGYYLMKDIRFVQQPGGQYGVKY